MNNSKLSIQNSTFLMDVTDLVEDLGYKPSTPIQDGINKFVDWYLDFFGYEKDGSKK